MYLIVGLGNPGEKYHNTRHNVGRMMVEYISREGGGFSWVKERRYHSFMSQGVMVGEEVRLCLPEVFMNNSGKAVKEVVKATGIALERLIVIYDDIDIPHGEVKISFGRGSGGHRGLRSIITELGSKDFIRLRVGIAPVSREGDIKKPRGLEAVNAYVLGTFSPREAQKNTHTTKELYEALCLLFKEGRGKAMTKINKEGGL